MTSFFGCWQGYGFAISSFKACVINSVIYKMLLLQVGKECYKQKFGRRINQKINLQATC